MSFGPHPQSGHPMTQHNHLEHWLAQGARFLAALDAGPGPGVATREADRPPEWPAANAKPCCGANCPTRPLRKTLDFLIVGGRWQAVFQGTPAQSLNPWARCMAAGLPRCSIQHWVALCTRMEPGRGYTTAELGINLVKAITPKVQRVRAEGRVIHSGANWPRPKRAWWGRMGAVRARHHHLLGFDLPHNRRHEIPSHHAARWQPSTLHRLLHQVLGMQLLRQLKTPNTSIRWRFGLWGATLARQKLN